MNGPCIHTALKVMLLRRWCAAGNLRDARCLLKVNCGRESSAVYIGSVACSLSSIIEGQAIRLQCTSSGLHQTPCRIEYIHIASIGYT